MDLQEIRNQLNVVKHSILEMEYFLSKVEFQVQNKGIDLKEWQKAELKKFNRNTYLRVQKLHGMFL